MGTTIQPCSDLNEERAQISEICALLEKTPEISEFLERLMSLEQALQVHFEHEEAPGKLGALNHAVRVQQLLQQHPVILDAMHDLEAQLKNAMVRTNKIVAMIRNHEAQANELMGDSLYDDFGGGD